MQDLPTDLLRFQILSVLGTRTAVRLTHTSLTFFNLLRHKIRRTDCATAHRYITQSHSQSRHMGLCSDVSVPRDDVLNRLLSHISDERIDKLRSLSHLEINFDDSFHTNRGWSLLISNNGSLSSLINFNRSLAGITLLSSLTTLIFGYHFNQSLDNVTLPQSLRALTFGHDFDHSLHKSTLPDGLHTLRFGFSFNRSLDHVTLPQSLKILTFGACFDQTFTNVTIPPNLQTLTVGKYYNDRSLHHLELRPSLEIVRFVYTSLILFVCSHFQLPTLIFSQRSDVLAHTDDCLS